jgi:hypothetical protein
VAGELDAGVHRSRAVTPDEHRVEVELIDLGHFLDQRVDAHRDIAEQPHERAAHAGHEQRPERRVVAHADDHLDVVGDRLLDEEALADDVEATRGLEVAGDLAHGRGNRLRAREA